MKMSIVWTDLHLSAGVPGNGHCTVPKLVLASRTRPSNYSIIHGLSPLRSLRIDLFRPVQGSLRSNRRAQVASPRRGLR